ncbi:MAG: class I SAM-dependent methyltransferase [Thiobacillus sp.]|nr:class I SAM-dependent methyltransferase [Thiobacillus sp.]
MSRGDDETIIESWRQNVTPWVAAIENGEIASRVEVTNQAIVDAVTQCAPASVLDAGCDEGWLVRELVARGIDALGIDAIPGFIERARQHAVGRYRVLSYEETSYSALGERFDVVVCNFSLLGEDSVTGLFRQIPAVLNPGGVFIVQTLHPLVYGGAAPDEDGWREGSWAGCSKRFGTPAPWYFRTIESWKNLFQQNGFLLANIVEPMNPTTQIPASIIFVGKSRLA